MIANLEGTYSSPGPSKAAGSGTSFAFQAPPSYARALAWSGIDLVNMANNHSMDYLRRGYLQTQAALKNVRVAYAGPPHTITIVKVHGIRVAVMGFSPYPWSAPLNDIPAAAALVRRAVDEANIVIVLMHAGAEGADQTHTPYGTQYFLGEDRGNVRAFAHAMVRAGADLVLGSGPHVIRGIERYRNRLIAYSLGNFAGWRNFALGGNLSLSGLLTVRITKAGRILGGRWSSLRLDSPGVPTLDGSKRSLGWSAVFRRATSPGPGTSTPRGISPRVETLGRRLISTRSVTPAATALPWATRFSPKQETPLRAADLADAT